jgi:hypothetical protein
MTPLQLEILDLELSVCRLAPKDPIPGWAVRSSFFSISKSYDELSIVCESALIPPDVRSENGWRALKVKGPLDFSLTGILASIAVPLADRKISLFAVSTFDTDYVLVKGGFIGEAVAALSAAGHKLAP